MTDQEKTGLGNYFVANYPPFSAWKPTGLPDAFAAAHRAWEGERAHAHRLAAIFNCA